MPAGGNIMAIRKRSTASALVGLMLLAMAGSGLAPANASDDLLCEITGTCPDPNLDPAPVPTASQVVFTRVVEGQVDLAIVDTSSGQVTALDGLNSSAADQDPAVSPDGKLIAFASDRAGDFDLYVAELDQPATTLRRVTSARGDENHPEWSPASGAQRLAYTMLPHKGRDPRHVRIADLTAGTDTPLDLSRYSFSPTWSPAGDRIAVAGSNTHGILVYDLGSTAEPLQLTAGDTSRWDKSPDWSPDGQWIVFGTYRQEFVKGRYVTADWTLMASRPTDSDGDGRGDDLHTVHAGGESYVDLPDWHPDGTTLAFSNANISNGNLSAGKIMRVTVAETQGRLQAGVPEELTSGADDYQPQWRRG